MGYGNLSYSALVKLPKIPVAHSSELKVKDVTELTVACQPVVPNIESTHRGPSAAALPAVQLSLDGSVPIPKQSGYFGRSMTSVAVVTAEEASKVKRSELKSSWLKANDVKNPFKYTVEELNEIMQEKISSGFHGLKHLFRSHTANGNGLVSREALHRILIGLCGYVSKDLFNRYLKSLSLQHSQYVSFEMFISKFLDNEVVKKEWLKPLQQAKASQEAVHYPEQQFRNPGHVIRSNIAPASYFMLFLKEFVKQRKFMPEFHVPEAIRKGKEELLRLHLRRIVTSLSGYDISDSELDKLWLRFDYRGVGSVPCEDFYKVIGYNQSVDTTQLPLTANSEPPSKNAPAIAQVWDGNCPTTPIGESHTSPVGKCHTPPDASVLLPTDNRPEKSVALKRTSRMSKKLKGLKSVIEELIYNMALPAVNLGVAFEPFDIFSDNFVSKIDFRRVLNEFGFPIGALDLETFLSRNSLRVLNDLIEYKEFVQRFTSRDEFGLVNKVVNDSQHLFNTEPQKRLSREGSGIEGWTAEELEAGLVECLMGSYIKLLLNLRNLDPKATRLLPVDKVRSLLEKILTRVFNHTEWKYILTAVGVTADGLIPYENLIAIINNRRPTWNETTQLGHQVTVIRRPATTVELERLREAVKKDEIMHTHFSPLDHLRSLDDISSAIRELMKTRFQALDYAYKHQDRKMTGRLDKNMLMRVLKECDLDFVPKEMDKLWGTFAVAPDGLYTWSKFCQRYISDKNKLHQASETLGQKEEDTLTSAGHMKPPIGRRPLISQASSRAATTRSKITDPVLTRLKFEIVSNYDTLESLFKALDGQNWGHVTTDEAVEAFKAHKIKISGEDKRHICQLFDLEQSSRFHYNAFLSLYKQRMQSRQCGTSVPSACGSRSSVVRPTTAVLNNRLIQQLQGRIPEMRRQFKKSDPLGQGIVSVREFKLCLETLGVNCAGDDSFSEVTSLFDHSLNGRINYEEFSSLCQPKS